MDESYDLYYGDYGDGSGEGPGYGGGSVPYGEFDSNEPTYYYPGQGGGGGGGYNYGPGNANIIKSMAEADAEKASEKEWAMRGSAGAPNKGASSAISRPYGGGTAGGGTIQRPVAPTAPALVYPDLKMPEWDESKVKAYTQRAAAPYTRKLRESVQKAMGGRYENPNVKRMTLRDALQGYGTALEGVMGRANQEGQQAYGQEYNRQATETQANWQKEIQRKNMEYQTQVNQANAEYQMLMKEFFASNYPTQSGGSSRIPYGYQSPTWQ
jgi:hypothetical protein